nr:GGDEF domain-containing protein [uncultured Desulfobacter sp.]
MKPLRIYSIQTRMSLILLLVVFVVTFSGVFSIYFSQRYLVSARLVASSLMPRIQRAKDIQQTVTQVTVYSWSLSNTNSRTELHQVFAHLTTALATLGTLTATLSNEDSGIDIVSLNFLSQAIQSQTHLIFQVKAQLLKQEREQVKIVKGLRRDLLTIGVEFFKTHSRAKENHMIVHKIMVQSLAVLEIFDTQSASLSDIKQLEDEFAKIKNIPVLLTADTNAKDRENLVDAFIERIVPPMGKLLKLKQNSLSIVLKINDFNKAQGELSDQLTGLTTRYIDRISTDYHEKMELLLRQEKYSVYLTIGVFVSSLVLLLLFYRQIVVRRFGERLSMISRAMRSGVAGEKEVPLPVADHDEIADMARAAHELLNKARALNKLATIDELTKVYNRRQFFHLANIEAQRAKRKQGTAVIAILDIDHFKRVNDTWGHIFGDKALFEFAQACKTVIREVDLFARYGGEEFILLMPDATMAEGKIVADRVLKTIQALDLFTESGQKVQITTSIGVAQAALTTEKLSQSIKKADEALYTAKNSGRNRVEIYSEKECC